MATGTEFMPDRTWQPRQARFNASISTHRLDEVEITLVHQRSGPSLMFVGASWGPWVVYPKLLDKPDFEAVRVEYLKLHPEPPPKDSRPTSYAHILKEIL